MNSIPFVLSKSYIYEIPALNRRAAIKNRLNEQDMKMTHASPLIQMEKEQLQKLCTEVKETLATETHIKTISKQPFGVADLWNIHRNTRYRVQRRNSMF